MTPVTTPETAMLRMKPGSPNEMSLAGDHIVDDVRCKKIVQKKKKKVILIMSYRFLVGSWERMN